MPDPTTWGPYGRNDRKDGFGARFASLLRKLTENFLRSNSRSEPKNHPFYRYARRGPHVVGSGILLIVLFCFG